MLFVLFHLGADRYVLPAADVTEVLPLLALNAVPGAPAGVAGLADYRGTVVPVVDFAALTAGRPAERRVSTRLLIVRYPDARGNRRLLGLVVERATETIALAPEAFAPAGVRSETARYLGPIARDAAGLIQRVSVAALLTEPLRAALYPVDDGDCAPALPGRPAAGGSAANAQP